MQFWFELVKTLGSVATAITAVVGVAIALRGLRKWREEAIGKRKAELALASFYEVRDVFAWVRSRGILKGEGRSRRVSDRSAPREGGAITYPIANESDKLETAKDLYFVPIERLRAEKELFAKLQAQRYTFAAYFGQDMTKSFDVIQKAHNDIIVAASVLIEMATDYETRDTREQDAPLRNTLGWGPQNRPDNMDESIDKAIAEIEALCRPILEARPS
jgi:hypothetical protein